MQALEVDAFPEWQGYMFLYLLKLLANVLILFIWVSFQVAENFVHPLLDAVLLDYQRNVPAAREPEVLSTMASIVNKLEVS